MKLYYAPGTCALAVDAALIWSGEPYEREEVDLDDPGSAGSIRRARSPRWSTAAAG